MELKSIIDYAAKNKILLQALRRFNVNNDLRISQENAYNEILKTVREISKLLEGYKYVFFKLVKPVVYVPADIDLLVSINSLRDVIKTLIKANYMTVVRDPYCITLAKGHLMIDVYTYPSLGGVIFLDGQKLLEYSKSTTFNHIKIPILEPYAEAVVVAAHALYKERIFTFNDYLTISAFISKRSFELAEFLNCENALRYTINLIKKVSTTSIELPYKLSIPEWYQLWMEKFSKDDLTQSSLIKFAKTLVSRRFGKQLIAKFTGETY